MKRFVARYIATALFLLLTNCATPPPLVLYSKPMINAETGWKSYEACGYECRPLVDFLEGEGVKIRLESFNYKKNFEMLIFFITKKSNIASIDPSMISIELSNGQAVRAKAQKPGFRNDPKFNPNDPNYDSRKFLRETEPLVGDIPLSMEWDSSQNCAPILVFFDVEPPHPQEEFKLQIGGLVINGRKVVVPKIDFRPAIRRGGPGIILSE